MGQRVSDTIHITADPDAVFEVVTDLEAYPSWAEGMLEAEVLSTTDDGYPRQARFLIDARVAEVRYTLEYSYDGYDITWQLVEGEMLTQLDGAYELRDAGETTEVTYRLEADVDMPVPGFLKKRAARAILDQGLSGLKERVEGAT